MSAQIESRVTVVVLTHNRLSELLPNLERLIALPERPPIILVDNGSTDGTSEQVRQRYPQIDLIRSERNLGAAGRNLGVERAATPYVAFCDDDTAWMPGSISRAADILQSHPEIAVLSAHVLVGEEQRDDPSCRLMGRSPLDSRGLPGRAILGFMAGASVIRTDAFCALKGFRSELCIGAEETLLALDLAAQGWRLVYSREVTTRHFPSAARNSEQRSLMLARNRIWIAWMRLPLLAALRQTFRMLAMMARNRCLLRGSAETLSGMRCAISERRVVPRRVQHMWYAIEPSLNEESRGTALADLTEGVHPSV